MKMETIYLDEIPEATLAQIRAVKSFYGVGSFATYLKSLSDEKTLANLSKRKYDLRQSLEHFNQPLLSLNTSQENGKETAMKRDYWEYPSQESWIIQSLMEQEAD